MLKSKIIGSDSNYLYKIVRIYNNLKIDLQINFSISYDYEKLNHIKNNIIKLSFTGDFPNINMKNLEYLEIDTIH